ncbi:hypothetical protein HZB96_04780 [Candidatus Gottesmanbacteria bacterium]|nr:hypothetical protein [Candidatus Gottesmanbacteria bacterium]
MVSVTIPKQITKGEELVVIPKKLYEEFVRVLKSKSLTGTSAKLNTGLQEALEDVEAGRIVGPFSSLSEGLRVLKSVKLNIVSLPNLSVPTEIFLKTSKRNSINN